MPALTCTICSEVYNNNDVIYSTACGHIFHFACMQNWRSRSTSCPQCREHNPTSHRIYLEFDETDNEQKLNEAQALLNTAQVARSELQTQMDELEQNFYDMQRLLVDAEEKNIDLESSNQYLKAQNDSRDDEINKLINNCTMRSSEEAELLRAQLSSLEERQKEVLLELEQKSEECLKLHEASNHSDNNEKLLQRQALLYESTRRQYEAVEKALKVQIEHLNAEITTKNEMIIKQKNIIAELGAENKYSGKFADIHEFDCEFQKQKLTQYIDNSSTEMLMQKLKLERELEKSSDKIMELEETLVRTKEMLNLEIESFKADIERKDNEIKNRKDEHAKMMDRLSTLGSKATEISLRKRNEILVNKLEETRCDLEKAFKSCAEKDVAILKLKQTESVAKSKLEKFVDQEALKKAADATEKKSTIATVKQTSQNTLIEEDCNEGMSVFLSGVPEEDIKKPLISTALMYTEIMSVPCKPSDIRGVYKLGSHKNIEEKVIINLLIKFASIDMKVKFLLHKEKLQTRGINAADSREKKNKGINPLFQHAKILRGLGYNFVFCKNHAVFVRKNKSTPIIKITCMRDVDDLVKEAKPPQQQAKPVAVTVTEECDDQYYRQ